MVSWQTGVLSWFLARGGGPRAGDFERSNAKWRKTMDRAGFWFGRARGVREVEASGCPVPAVWYEPRETVPGRHFLYLHGGGYVAGSHRSHGSMVSRLAAACRARTLLPDYRLAPEHPFPAAWDDALAVCAWLEEQGVDPSRTLIGGDSAGGGLTVTTLVGLRERGGWMPAGAVLFSPWSDLTVSGDTLRTHAAIDPYIHEDGIRACARACLGSLPADDPRASPLLAELHGLPPSLCLVGEREVILADSTRLAERLDAAGSACEIEIWDGMMHVWPFFARLLPEGRSALERVGAWADQRLADA